MDDDGNDLLNPNQSFEKSIDLNELRIFYVIDGEEILVHNPMMDAPKGFKLNPPQGKYEHYFLTIGLNSKTTETRTLIKWSETDVDTVDARIVKGEGYEICTKMILNGSEIWNAESGENDERAITIVK